MHRFCVAAIAALFAGQTLAQDTAVLIGGERYRHLDRVVNGAELTRAAQAMSQAGYVVAVHHDDSLKRLRSSLTSFLENGATADRLVVAISGRFATDGARSWYLPTSAKQPDLFGIGAAAISVDSVLDALAQTPQNALLLLGVETGKTETYDTVLMSGVGDLIVPEGVTVVTLRPNDVRGVLESVVARPGGDIMDVVARNARVVATGYTPDSLILQDAATPAGATNAEQQRLWETLRDIDTTEAYQRYIDRYPFGEYAQVAQEMIDEIRDEPDRAARLIEEALQLNREERRQVQSNLVVLGYNTRGVDGIFGRGTRQAIINWQQQAGFQQTSYLNDDQLLRIDAQARRRSAQIELEAERKRELDARRDRTFWEETGAAGDEAGLRAYLARFPDGSFADQAKTALKKIENAKLRQAADVDRDAWNVARTQDSEDAYLDYLTSQPRGAFRVDATARVEAIRRSRNTASQNEAAIAAERALGLTGLTRRLVEARLTHLQHAPGLVDGVFDAESRRAIRRFQQARGLPATGYLDQAAVVQLLVN